MGEHLSILLVDEKNSGMMFVLLLWRISLREGAGAMVLMDDPRVRLLCETTGGNGAIG